MSHKVTSVIEADRNSLCSKEHTNYKLYNFAPTSLEQMLLWVLYAHYIIYYFAFTTHILTRFFKIWPGIV